MHIRIFLKAAALLITSMKLQAQTIYVDPARGNDTYAGTTAAPLATLDKAVTTANNFSGQEPVNILLFPGLYILTDKVTIQSASKRKTGIRYSIEATLLPDDTAWSSFKMPVIQSVSPNNSVAQFPHSVGILVATADVNFRGIKFIGNAHPSVTYYYPITKEDSLLSGLEVSQCYFAGDRNTAPIQGGVWAHGPNTKIDHCIFYHCNNALLFFKGVQHFSVTNTIICGAYEAAMWVGLQDGQFVFRNNIVADCEYLWTIPPNAAPKVRFEHSQFINITNYAGNWKKGMVPASHASFVMENVQESQNTTGSVGENVKQPAKLTGLPVFPETFMKGPGLFKHN
jgi:hypothetical protein